MKTLTILAICLIASTAFAVDPNLISIFESNGATYIITSDSPQAQLVLESVKTDNNQPVKTDSNWAKKIKRDPGTFLLDLGIVFGIVPGWPH